VSPYARTVIAYVAKGVNPLSPPSMSVFRSSAATNRTTPAIDPWPYALPLNSATAASDCRSVRRFVPSRRASSSPNAPTSPCPMSLQLNPARSIAATMASVDAVAVTTRTLFVESVAATASIPGTCASACSTLATHFPHAISTMNSSERATGASSAAVVDSAAVDSVADADASRRGGGARTRRVVGRRDDDARGGARGATATAARETHDAADMPNALEMIAARSRATI